jgi:signal transduction histidine kinase
VVRAIGWESKNVNRTTVVPRSLRGLRLRLTAWYVGTLLVVLALVGIGLFATVTARIDSDLDVSLRGAARAMAQAVASKGPDAASVYLSTPDRTLILFDSAGKPLGQSIDEPWLGDVARRAAAQRAEGLKSHHEGHDRILRAYAQPLQVSDGRTFVAVAVADEIEIEDKYTALITAFVVAALFALVLVGFGGWFIAAKSTEPVDRSVEQMRRFMADAAHELRTPITVVRGRAEVALQRERNSSEYQDALRGIEAESTRIGRIVEDLLTLARADAGERPIERQRVFLDDIVLDSAEAAKALAVRRDVKVDVAEFDEAPITGDPVLIRQLVMILLDNAIKFSPAGAPVEIGVWNSNDGATVRVSDRGPGIPPDQLPHVFDRFYRGDAARSRAGTSQSEGTGLGLSIAQWIAQAHAATIRIDSAIGQGTAVVVQFPAPSSDGVSSS